MANDPGVDGVVVFHRSVRRAQRRDGNAWFGGDKNNLFQQVLVKLLSGEVKQGKFPDTYEVDVEPEGFYRGTVGQAQGNIDIPAQSARVFVWSSQAVGNKRKSRCAPGYDFAIVKVEAA